MRLAYYGTPDAAVPALERLVRDGRPPILVTTRRDRPRGRGLTPGPSPVRAAAERLGLPVVTPRRAGDPDEIERLRALAPDLLVVVAYGQIFPPELLEVPRLGALNLHFSLLPRHRGASPVQAALLAGDAETGVTIQWMTEGLDEGPVAMRRAVPIAEGEDAGALEARLAEIGAEALSAAIAALESPESPESHRLSREAQDPARATYAPRIARDAGRLSLGLSGEEIVRRVRAYTPEPGAFFEVPGGRLLVARAASDVAPRGSAPSGATDAEPGTILAVDRDSGVRLTLREGSVRLVRVRPSGRREMSAADFVNGARLKPGDRLPILDRGEGGSPHGGWKRSESPS